MCQCVIANESALPKRSAIESVGLAASVAPACEVRAGRLVFAPDVALTAPPTLPKCVSPTCSFLSHSELRCGGHCCLACQRKAGNHGPKCQRVLALEPAPPERAATAPDERESTVAVPCDVGAGTSIPQEAAIQEAALRALLSHSSEEVRAATAAALKVAAAEASSAAAPAVPFTTYPAAPPAIVPVAAEPAGIAAPAAAPTPTCARAIPVGENVAVEPAAAGLEALPSGAPCTTAAAPQAETESEQSATAVVVGSSPLTIGADVREDASAVGDVTEEIAELVGGGLRQAWRLGRVVVAVGAKPVPVCTTAVLFNDGAVTWPSTTVLAIVVGDPLTLPQLPLGPVAPGEAVEVCLDLLIPERAVPGGLRSAWSVVDGASGETLGPLLLFEVLWMPQ